MPKFKFANLMGTRGALVIATGAAALALGGSHLTGTLTTFSEPSSSPSASESPEASDTPEASDAPDASESASAVPSAVASCKAAEDSAESASPAPSASASAKPGHEGIGECVSTFANTQGQDQREVEESGSTD